MINKHSPRKVGPYNLIIKWYDESISIHDYLACLAQGPCDPKEEYYYRQKLSNLLTDICERAVLVNVPRNHEMGGLWSMHYKKKSYFPYERVK